MRLFKRHSGARSGAPQGSADAAYFDDLTELPLEAGSSEPDDQPAAVADRPEPIWPRPAADPASSVTEPVGWLAVIAGPGRGHATPLFDGLSMIGRGADQAVTLDFGDRSISISNHATIAFDAATRQFMLKPGKGDRTVRLNGEPVLTAKELTNASEIRIGRTTLRFVAFCDSDFGWSDTEPTEEAYVAVI